MKVSKAGQLTYFAVIPIPTTDKGMYFLFYAVDAFTNATYNLGIEERLNEETLFVKLGDLLDHDKFKPFREQSFTIMFPLGEEISKRFNTFLGTNGNAIFDEKATQEVAEVLTKEGVLGKMDQ